MSPSGWLINQRPPEAAIDFRFSKEERMDFQFLPTLPEQRTKKEGYIIARIFLGA